MNDAKVSLLFFSFISICEMVKICVRISNCHLSPYGSPKKSIIKATSLGENDLDFGGMQLEQGRDTDGR